MSVISGTIGAIMGSNAAEDAANTAAAAQQEATAAQVAEARRQYDINRQDFSPYMAAGYQGLAGLTGQTQYYTDPTTGQITTYQGQAVDRTVDPFTGQQMALPSYAEMVSSQLSDYSNDPSVTAQKALAQKELARQQAARGLSSSATSANAAAELGMKYDVSGYDRYQQQLQNSYANALSEFGTKYGINSDKIADLQNLTKIGQGAAGSISASGANTTSAINQALQAQGSQSAASALQAGATQASLYSGLGNLVPSALSAANSAQNLGWFGSGSGSGTITPYSSFTGWNPATDTGIGSASYLGSGQLWD